MKNLYFILFIGLLFLCFKCNNHELLSQEKTPFTLEKSSFQKFVPGERNQPIYYEVGFELSKMESKYSLDSVLWSKYMMTEFKLNGDQTIFSTAPSSLVRVQESTDNMKKSEMLVFYSTSGNQYFHRVENVKELESIVLP